MNKELAQKTDEWKKLERMTFEQRQKAEAFYENELMQLIIDDYISRNYGEVRNNSTKYLIISVGTSYEPIVLNLKLLEPEKVLFLYTQKSAVTLDKVVRFCGLQAAGYEKRMVNELDPLDIYRAVMEIYLAWGKPDNILIDFTGGTKSMSATASLAGAALHAQMIYVASNDYLPDFRKPNPGSEMLVYIEDPLAVFGDMECAKGMELFGRRNYAGAALKLEELKDNIPDPALRQQVKFIWLLAKAYAAWDELNFIPAYGYMKQLNRELQRDKKYHSDYVLMDWMDILIKQEKILGDLIVIPDLIRLKKQEEILKKSETTYALMFSLYQNAGNRKHQKKYDMAALLYYRLLEMIEQRRLSHYALNVSKMDYTHMKTELCRNEEVKKCKSQERLKYLKEQILELRTELFHGNVSDYLPAQISLLDGYELLAVFGDELLGEDRKTAVSLLKRIRSMVILRNNSMFAHGLGPVSETSFLKFEAFVLELFQKFCDVEKVSMKYYSEAVWELDPRESEYYPFGGTKDGGSVY